MFRSFVAGVFAGGTFGAASTQGAMTTTTGRGFSTSVIQSTKSIGPLTLTTIPEFPTYVLVPPSTTRGSGTIAPASNNDDTKNTSSPSAIRAFVNKVWSSEDQSSTNTTTATDLHLNTISNTTDAIYVLARVKADDELPVSTPAEQPSMNLSVALDISGSMHGTRLEEAKKALKFMIQQCTPKDHLSIALFESKASVALEPMQMDEKGQQRALAIVDGFQTAGCTNLSAGIDLALGLLKGGTSWLKKTFLSSEPLAQEKTKSINASLAFTDGYANEGVVETNDICRFLSPKVEEANAALHTFGFGAHHNEDMLKRIAGVGSGSYYFIDSPQKMKEVFADCLGGVMSTVAQDIKLTIKPRPGFYVDEVFTSYKSSTDSQSGAKTVTLRDLYKSEQRDVLIRLRRNNNGVAEEETKKTPSTQFVDVDLSYDSLSSGQRESGAVACGAALVTNSPSSGHNAATGLPTTGSPEIRDHKVRFAVLHGMDESRDFASSGDMSKAKDTLSSLRSTIWPSHKPAPSTETEKNLQQDVDNALEVMNQSYENYSFSGGAKSMLQQMESHKFQRYAAQTESYGGAPSSASSWSSSWDTKAKKAMRARADSNNTRKV